jgi:hypothetical protein
MSVAVRIVLVSYAAILFILGSFRPLSVTDFKCVHCLSWSGQRLGFAYLATANPLICVAGFRYPVFRAALSALLTRFLCADADRCSTGQT